jgi:hypothetical protein
LIALLHKNAAMGANIAEVLEPDGFFFIADEHPFASVFHEDDGRGLRYDAAERRSSPIDLPADQFS